MRAEPPEAEIAALAERVRRGAPPSGTTRVVLVDGRSGAGKTVLATRLAGALGAPIVELESLYDGWDGLERGIELLRTAVLEPLAQGLPVVVPHYDWVAGRWAEPWPLGRPEYLVVEGVGAGARASAAYAVLLIWVELADEERRERALARDGELYRPHWDRWAAQEEALLAREETPARADVIVGPSARTEAAAPGSPVEVVAVTAARAALVEEVRQLFLEYAQSLSFDLCFQDFEQELAGLPGAYAPPDGCLLLALVGGNPVGCAAVRRFDAGSAELKRLWVRPAGRGTGTGRLLVDHTIEFARSRGYAHVRLDTTPEMRAAQRLYRSLGFVETSPYRANPIPGTIYLELSLGDAGAEPPARPAPAA